MTAELSQEIEAQEWEANQSSFSVSLIDKTKFRINRVYYSDKHDIAIFSLPENNCPYLPKGGSKDLLLAAAGVGAVTLATTAIRNNAAAKASADQAAGIKSIQSRTGQSVADARAAYQQGAT